jgi:hypothetical protein
VRRRRGQRGAWCGEIGGLEIVEEARKSANFETDEIPDEREKGGRRGREKAGLKLRRRHHEIVHGLHGRAWQPPNVVDQGAKKVQHFRLAVHRRKQRGGLGKEVRGCRTGGGLRGEGREALQRASSGKS